MRRERPAMDCEDSDRHAHKECRGASQHSRFGAVGVENLGPLAPQERDRSNRPRMSRQGLTGLRSCRNGMNRAPAASARSLSGPGPCAATATSKRSTSAGRSEAT